MLASPQGGFGCHRRPCAAFRNPQRRRGDFLNQAAPAFESMPPGEVSIEHGASATPHFGKAASIRAEAAQRIGKKLALAGLDDNPAIMLPDKTRNLAVARGDCDDRS